MKTTQYLLSILSFAFVGIAIAADNTPLATILPAGNYTLVTSPAKPDLKNVNDSPDLADVKVSYKDDKAYISFGSRQIPISYYNGSITFTVLPVPQAGFGTTVFSGKLWSERMPGRIIGKSYRISGWPSDEIDQNLFTLQKKAAEQDAAANP